MRKLLVVRCKQYLVGQWACHRDTPCYMVYLYGHAYVCRLTVCPNKPAGLWHRELVAYAKGSYNGSE